MKFRKWVKAQGGPKGLGLAMGISQFTIYKWFQRGSTPEAQLMIELVKRGRGAFDYKDIVFETKNSKGWR